VQRDAEHPALAVGVHPADRREQAVVVGVEVDEADLTRRFLDVPDLLARPEREPDRLLQAADDLFGFDVGEGRGRGDRERYRERRCEGRPSAYPWLL
jgi:hypothetical protein